MKSGGALPSVWPVAVVLTTSARVCTCACVSDNAMGDTGVTAVAEALKVNTSVQEINLASKW